jgi:hypothetical protein
LVNLFCAQLWTFEPIRDLKTVEGQPSVGSNPTLSANNAGIQTSRR